MPDLNFHVERAEVLEFAAVPTLLFKLTGEAEIRVRATSNTTADGHLVSTFKGLPDAQVSRFDMRIRGGAKRGILAVSGENANLCSGPQTTKLASRGHNGKLTRQSVRVKTPCAKKRSAKRRKLRLTR